MKVPLWVTVTVTSGTPPIVIASVPVLFEVFASPPPDTVSVLVNEPVAFEATLTVNVITGYELPLANASDRVQLEAFNVHVHPVPVSPVAVKPAGNVSITVAAPLVAAVPALVTVIANVPPWPWVKLPVWIDVTVRSGTPEIVVPSVPVLFEVFVSPPPEIVTVLVNDPAAFEATFTSKAIGG